MKTLTILALTGAFLAAPLAGFAADKPKAKPYPLDTCLVSGEKLGEMGKAYEFDYKGQQIKLCCKDCLKDFNKDPQKYLKKLAAGNKGQDEHKGH